MTWQVTAFVLKFFSKCYQLLLALWPLPASAFWLLDCRKKSLWYRFWPGDKFFLLCLGSGGIHSFLPTLCSLQRTAFQTFSLCYRNANIHLQSQIIYFSHLTHSNRQATAWFRALHNPANAQDSVRLLCAFSCNSDTAGPITLVLHKSHR